MNSKRPSYDLIAHRSAIFRLPVAGSLCHVAGPEDTLHLLQPIPSLELAEKQLETLPSGSGDLALYQGDNASSGDGIQHRSIEHEALQDPSWVPCLVERPEDSKAAPWSNTCSAATIHSIWTHAVHGPTLREVAGRSLLPRDFCYTHAGGASSLTRLPI